MSINHRREKIILKLGENFEDDYAYLGTLKLCKECKKDDSVCKGFQCKYNPLQYYHNLDQAIIDYGIDKFNEKVKNCKCGKDIRHVSFIICMKTNDFFNEGEITEIGSVCKDKFKFKKRCSECNTMQDISSLSHISICRSCLKNKRTYIKYNHLQIKMPYGQHAGKTLEYIYNNDFKYIQNAANYFLYNINTQKRKLHFNSNQIIWKMYEVYKYMPRKSE